MCELVYNKQTNMEHFQPTHNQFLVELHKNLIT